MDNIAFVGFGEAALAFVTGWGQTRPQRISAFDIKTDAGDTRAEMLARYNEHRVEGAERVQDALMNAETIFSLVTADQAYLAAGQASAEFPDNALWLDCNSCSPDTKRQAAEVIEAAGGRYVDVAVMAPVHPLRHKVPLLVSGPHAEEGQKALNSLGMNPRYAGPEIGQASAIKMLRSVMIKGMEALSAECFLAARRAGVDEQVLASLEASDPEFKWRKRGAYNLERMIAHGQRRAAEMHEVAATVKALGLPSGMSAAAAEWHDRIGRLEDSTDKDDLASLSDHLLNRL